MGEGGILKFACVEQLFEFESRALHSAAGSFYDLKVNLSFMFLMSAVHEYWNELFKLAEPIIDFSECVGMCWYLLYLD